MSDTEGQPQLAICRLLLVRDPWVPLGLNTTLSAEWP